MMRKSKRNDITARCMSGHAIIRKNKVIEKQMKGKRRKGK